MTGRRTARERSARAIAAVALLIVLTASPLASTRASAEPAPSGTGEYTLTSKTIWSFYTEAAPPMDDPKASIWDYPLQVIGLVPGHVALSGGTSLDIRSIYTDTDLYMRVVWHDVVENSGAPVWVYHDGNWTFDSPFIDGLGLYFPIGDPLGAFNQEGCMRTCHAQDWANPSNQERKFTYADGESGDLWFWSAGLTDPWDFAIDGYVTNHPSDNNVGYYEDPEMGLGLVKNRHLTEYMQYIYLSRPVYMQNPNIPPSVGPDYLIRGEETVFDQNVHNTTTGEAGINPITHDKWQNGDVVGGYVLDHLPTEGLGQIAARGSYDVVDQTWSLLLRRPLVTGDAAHDVQFDDLGKTYPFAISLFGDIMGGGDASAPFTEPSSGTRGGADAGAQGARCVMNKVTNSIGLRFRPVVRAALAPPGAPAGWDGAAWDAAAPPVEHELIHWGGEIHDAWDHLNVSAAYDGVRLYLHLRYFDPNGTGELGAEAAFLRPGPLSLEETYRLLGWSGTAGHFVTSQGEADVWHWGWNATSGPPDGTAQDMMVRDGRASNDTVGPDDVTARTWSEGPERHIVLSRALLTGHPGEDLEFGDLARSYAARVGLYTGDWKIWLVTFPITLMFAPDAADRQAPAPVGNVTVRDGRDSDALVSWAASTEADFAHYGVYASTASFTSVEGMVPVARISDINATSVHLRGLAPGRTWHVAVVAVDDNRNAVASVAAASIAVTDTTPPPALAGVKAFDGLDSDLLVRWNATDLPDFDHYDVYFSPAPFGTTAGMSPVATVRDMSVGSHRIGGLDVGRAYYAAVVAVDWAGNAVRDVAGVGGTCTDATAPPEVRGLDSSTPQDPASEGEVLLRWTSPAADDVATYRVYVSLTAIESVSNFEPQVQVPATNTSVVLGGLRPGTTYNFAVTAVDRAGHEGPSKTTVTCRASMAAPPPAVAGLAAVQVGPDSARVTWQPSNASLIAKYTVYMCRGPIASLDDPNVTVAGSVTPSPEPGLTVTGLGGGATYYFCVVAVDSRGRTSAGGLTTASVTVQAPREEGPSLIDTWGMPILLVSAIVLLAALIYVAALRQRRYGRLMSRRPSWERPRNGGKVE